MIVFLSVHLFLSALRISKFIIFYCFKSDSHLLCLKIFLKPHLFRFSRHPWKNKHNFFSLMWNLWLKNALKFYLCTFREKGLQTWSRPGLMHFRLVSVLKNFELDASLILNGVQNSFDAFLPGLITSILYWLFAEIGFVGSMSNTNNTAI